MPRSYGDGFLIVGDSAGFLNSARLKGIHLGIKSGMLAAETAFAGAARRGLSAHAAAASTRRCSRARGRKRGAVDAAQLPPGLRARPARRHVQRGAGHGHRAGAASASRTAWRATPGHERMARIQRYFGAGASASAGEDEVRRQATRSTRSTDVYNGGVSTRRTSRPTCWSRDTEVCITRCTRGVRQPVPALLPRRVYEPQPTADGRGKVQFLNVSNCFHCKTCDIMDPYQMITWVPPEGGGGPNYKKM